MHKRFSLGCQLAGLAAMAQSATLAHATSVGQAYDALPGLRRVSVAEPSEARLTAALSLGFGVTEASPGESASHQRSSAIVAFGIAPMPRLQLALNASARYDHHPDDAQGSDSGTVVEPRLAARWIEPLAPWFALGFELGAWFPGTEVASRTLRATSPHAALLATLARGAWTVTGRGGYRLDRSAEAAPDLARLRAGDRLALGLSDFDAALLGLGVSYRIGDLLLLAEGSADLLVGEGAPPLSESPIATALGARYAIDEVWSVELLGEASLSGRPALAATAPLVPVQPRYAALAGLRFRWPLPAEPVAPVPEALPERPPPARIDVRVEVRYSLPDDSPSPRVTLLQNGAEISATPLTPQEFEFKGALPGPATLSVVADGYEPSVQQIELVAGQPPRLAIELTAVAPQAQIRGLVRSLGGKGLPARVRVEPLGIEVSADPAGFFTLDVPAGRYDVTIQAKGYRRQQKSVVVEKDGVVVLNADLLKEP